MKAPMQNIATATLVIFDESRDDDHACRPAHAEHRDPLPAQAAQTGAAQQPIREEAAEHAAGQRRCVDVGGIVRRRQPG